MTHSLGGSLLMGHFGVDKGLGVQPLLDHDILALQEIFLTHGYHVIEVPSFGEGRLVINTFLRTLACFSSVCCLSLIGSVPGSVVSLYDVFLNGSLEMSEEFIDLYLLQNFYFDFCWIECSNELLSASWFEHFRSRLYDYGIVKSLPIVAMIPFRGTPSSGAAPFLSRSPSLSTHERY